MYVIDSSQTMAEITEILPEANGIFIEYNVDIYYYSNKPLRDVIEENDLDEDEIFKELLELYSIKNRNAEQSYAGMSNIKLIDYIITNYNIKVFKKLQESNCLIKKVFDVCGSEHKDLASAYQLIHDLQFKLEQLLLIEQDVLFKNIKEYEKNNKLNSPYLKNIKVIKNEIDMDIDLVTKALNDIREISRKCRLPRDQFVSYWSAIKTLEDIRNELFEKKDIRDNILLKRIETYLG